MNSIKRKMMGVSKKQVNIIFYDITVYNYVIFNIVRLVLRRCNSYNASMYDLRYFD